MPRRAAVAVACALALACGGCGSSGGGSSTGRPAAPPPTTAGATTPADTSTGASAATGTTPAPIRLPSGLSSEERAAARPAIAYAHRLSAQDYAGVCAVRVPRERRSFARTFGTCEAGFRAVAQKAGTGALQAFGVAQVTKVRIRGRLAGVDLALPGSSRAITPFASERVGGRWFVADVPDSRTP